MTHFHNSHLRANRHKTNHKKPFSKIKLGIYLLIIGYFFNIYYQDLLKKTHPNTESNQTNEILVDIEPGASLKSIAIQLKEKELIKSKLLFLREAKKQGLATKLQPGLFRIDEELNIPPILEILSTYIPQESKITIPEGYKISQIDELLSSEGLITPGEFTSCTQSCELEHIVLTYLPSQTPRNLEGLLFPDTYFVDTQDFQNESLIIKMLDNFENHLPADFDQKIIQLPKTDAYTAIIMASIIEREVLSQKDKELVSGILWKRFENGWPLGADATLLYQKEDNVITYQDLQNDNPYNTRKNLSFPPTPISNPGESSLKAAINPEESPYWFYLTTLDTGEVIYGRDNEEHNQNKNKYL